MLITRHPLNAQANTNANADLTKLLTIQPEAREQAGHPRGPLADDVARVPNPALVRSRHKTHNEGLYHSFSSSVSYSSDPFAFGSLASARRSFKYAPRG